MAFVRSKGFSLFEVLISLLLISLILFGLSNAEIYSTKEAKNAYFFSIASNQMNNLWERLSALTTHEGLSSQLSNWNQENKIVLPNGRGTINGTYPRYIATLYWGKNTTCRQEKIGSSGCLQKTMQWE